MAEPAVESHTVVLVEGESDRRAVSTLAGRLGRDLGAEGVSVLAMGGATNVGHFVEHYGPAGLGRRVAGLCDVGEVRHFERAFARAGLGADRGGDRESLSFFVCEPDLEGELIRAIGSADMQRFIDDQGELRPFRTFQRQPAQHARSIEDQLHRFIGTRSGRKTRYAVALIDRLDLSQVPNPLAELLHNV